MRSTLARRLVSCLAAVIFSASHGPALSQASASDPRITPMLNGAPGKDTDLDAWFASMHRWGVRQWMSFLIDSFHPDLIPGKEKFNPTVPFLTQALPEFAPYVSEAQVQGDEEHIRAAARLSQRYGIEYWCNLPFPIFPSQDRALLQKAEPELFASGRLRLSNPRLPDILRREVRALKTALPSLRGINLWLAEGAGGIEITREDLRRNGEWEPALIGAFDQETRAQGLEGIVFAHHFLHTLATHRSVFEVMRAFPRLEVMEDATWPEEDLLHPFLGYLPPRDRRLLFATNPVAINQLLDTEYLGEGVLPSVYPRWWQSCVSAAVRSGARTAMGRVFFWDGGRTDVNFDRLNAYLYTRLCYAPDADPRRLLDEAAREMFGPGIPPRLVDILWQTEPMLKRIIGLNGVDVLSHSRFPETWVLGASSARPNMKTIGDLFSPPGTVLYPPLTDELDNLKQWRWQNRSVARPVSDYLAEKRQALAWVNAVLPEVDSLSRSLAPRHHELFVHGYAAMASLAAGMELFVQTAAAVHEQSRSQFEPLARRWDAIAARAPATPFRYAERMHAFAAFLRNLSAQTGSG